MHITKNEILYLINANASERELQKLLKKDLSLIGETHSHPQGEYIAFSEFPISNGLSDFIVFTSRSRMDVVIFEIKGADFNFLNADETLNKNIENAILQMRTRFGHIHRNYEGFRKEVHDIRLTVEEGKTKYNSHLGENKFLHCDPNKDILYRGVVIGGRSTDDRLESKIKTDFESSTNPHIKLESWDSWLNKVKRA